ncbi:unnamed protein product [Rotaria sp. Silwood2]|nr:unnamed protein product [Rotaria sp. Silwood2]
MATTCTNERFLDPDQEHLATLKTSFSIEIPEQQQLVSLEEATKALKKSVKNLDTMVQRAKYNSVDQSLNLTVDEAAAIRLYTSGSQEPDKSISTQLNRALRSQVGNKVNPWLSYIKLFLSALNKVPQIEGTIFRFVKGNISDQYKGKCIWWGFSSCTRSQEALKNFHNNLHGYTVLMIECRNGKSIRDYSDNQNEEEVLLMPGTCLRVTDMSITEKENYVVYLEEIGKNLLLTSRIADSSSTVDAPPTSHVSNANANRSTAQIMQAKLLSKPIFILSCMFLGAHFVTRSITEC